MIEVVIKIVKQFFTINYYSNIQSVTEITD